MTKYVDAIADLSKDPVTGEYDTMGYIFFGFCMVASPILGPLYYLGRFVSRLRAYSEDSK